MTSTPGTTGTTSRSPARLLRARRRLRASLLELMCAAVGLFLGLTLPRVDGGPTVEDGRLVQLLFSLGLSVMGVVTIVFSLLFGVVQWSASAFSPRLNLFRDDPLVWRTFAVTIGVFVFCVTSGLASGNEGRVSFLVPTTAVLGALGAFLLIRALQTRAFLSMQLSEVLAAVAVRGRAVIDDVFPLPLAAGADALPSTTLEPPALLCTVRWSGPSGVIQQLDLRRLIEASSRADALVVFRVGVGSTIHESSPLADIYRGTVADSVVRAAVVRGTERSFDQDPVLAVRLLADISLRALSPAVNDPATAVDALDATGGLLQTLATRELRVGEVADRDGTTRVSLVLSTWEDYLRIGVEDVLPSATIPMVLERMHRLLSDLLETSPPPRHPPLKQLRDRVQAQLAACQPTPANNNAPTRPPVIPGPRSSPPRGT